MLLQCATGEAAAGEGAEWLPPQELAAVAELNEHGLGLLAEQALSAGGAGGPLLKEFAGRWEALDAAGRRRAAACPYLLLDAGFADAARWAAPPRAPAQSAPAHAPQVGDPPAGYAAFFTVPAAAGLAELVFIYAWHLARARPAAARVLLGMSAPAGTVIASLGLRQVRELAQARLTWLRPRWPGHVGLWRDLLRAAAAGENAALARARLRGLTLLAAEARLGPVRPGRT